jgi:peroxiredoxin
MALMNTQDSSAAGTRSHITPKLDDTQICIITWWATRHIMRYAIIFIFSLAYLFPSLAEPEQTNSSALTREQFSPYVARERELWKAYKSDSSTNAPDKLFEGARALQKDYPDYPDQVAIYQDMMIAIEACAAHNPAKARGWAMLLIDSPAPENFKSWSKGFLYRLDSQGKPMTLQFTAVDGRKVDLAEMRGKVVLVDFWGTHCGPCVAELPRVKAAFERFHPEGFEVIGISCDTDKKELEDYVKKRGISWPQYFDGKQQSENQFTVSFGVDGIPHMFLVDKKGLLRFDNVRARDDVHPKGDTTSFEDKISKLLAERR